jgi:hypothetical protein
MSSIARSKMASSDDLTAGPLQRTKARDGGLPLADVAVFGSFAAAGVAVAGLWLLRTVGALGGAGPFRSLAHGFAVAVLAFSLPAIVSQHVVVRATKVEDSPFASSSGLLLLALSGLALLGWAAHLLSWSMQPAIALLAAICFTAVAWQWWHGATLRERVIVPLLSGLLGTWMGACFWGYGMQHPAFLIKAVLSQHVPSYNPAIDTFFHASLINGLTNYGTVSIGLDGLVPLPYHALTHLLLAALAELGGVTAIDFLNAASPVILLPLLAVSFLLFAASVARTLWRPAATDRPMLARWPTWLVLFAALVGVVPQPFAASHFLQWNLVIHSETYGLSVSLALLWAAFLLSGLSARFVRDAKAAPRDCAVIALGVVGVCMVSMTKISTGLVVLAGTCWLFLRLRLYRSPAAIVALAAALAGVALIATSGAASTTHDSMQLVPFAFFRQFIGSDGVALFLALNFVWALLYVVLRGLYRRGTGGQGTSAIRWWSVSHLDLEFLGVLVIAGVLPGLLFDLPPKGPQSATVNVYFMDVQALFAAGLLLALIVSRGHDVPAFPAKGARLVPAILPALAVAALGIGIVPNLLHEFRNFNRRDVELRDLLRAYPEWPSSPEARILAGLASLGDSERGSLHGRVAIYIPQTNAAYWQSSIGCEVVPFLALGVAGIAMVDGLPLATCKSPVLDYYGYQQYGRRSATTTAPMTDDQLCQRAMQSAFQHILILEDFPVTAPRRLNCLA